jgi:hypothetical protein
MDAEEVVTSAITFTNGIVRDCRADSGHAHYAGFVVQFELRADERIAGITEVWVNSATRSVPRHEGLMTQLLSRPDDAVDGVPEPVARETVRALAADAWTRAATVAQTRVELLLQDAMASLRRRRDRDFSRLREYYEGIDQEIRRRARRAMARCDENALKAETSRLEATAQAFRGRIAELIDRYRVRVRVEPLAAVMTTLPVHHVTARIHRRSASRTIALAWNAVDRALELPACDGCGIGVQTVTLCDDRVHMLCDTCWCECATCGRSFCRACHDVCPRLHRQIPHRDH